ncbi:hypothetical protein PTTG_03210 [Puccinia triticina 1-1 BBBD Race 1]|uniref:Uncharacterized protein n=1 Tax=Puccinia triticina (isolate 1-1 / race 1 (BBBD)) TaxID=630390 RepID=A0A180GTA7_PUCT1|nr:hypothetical protein PTTG_03210 [Puccinia triticina 1-1 BBBD Race 1]
MKEASDHVKQLAQANAEDTPNLDEPRVQQEIAETLTSKPQKQKKTKVIAPTNRATRSSSKAPAESGPPPVQSTPKEGSLAICEEAQPNVGNALASLCDGIFGNPHGEGTAANPVDTNAAECPITTGDSSTKDSIRKKINWLTNRAFEVEDAGNTALAERYFVICKGLTKPKTVPAAGPQAINTQLVHPTPLANQVGDTIKSPALDKAGEKRQAGIPDATPRGVGFDDNARPASHNVGFKPFFKKNLTKLQAPLPLTIFNKVWQDKAYFTTPKIGVEQMELMSTRTDIRATLTRASTPRRTRNDQ